jgi:hypothetical protein
MQFRMSFKFGWNRNEDSPIEGMSVIRWGRACACLAVVAALAGNAQNPNPPGGALRTDRVDLPTPLNQAPDAVTQMKMHDKQTRQQDFAAANAERKKQISEDTAKLLKLATDLKTEVEKAAAGTLSLEGFRKAEEIEKLAHSVKEKMKLTVGAS